MEGKLQWAYHGTSTSVERGMGQRGGQPVRVTAGGSGCLARLPGTKRAISRVPPLLEVVSRTPTRRVISPGGRLIFWESLKGDLMNSRYSSAVSGRGMVWL